VAARALITFESNSGLHFVSMRSDHEMPITAVIRDKGGTRIDVNEWNTPSFSLLHPGHAACGKPTGPLSTRLKVQSVWRAAGLSMGRDMFA